MTCRRAINQNARRAKDDEKVEALKDARDAQRRDEVPDEAPDGPDPVATKYPRPWR